MRPGYPVGVVGGNGCGGGGGGGDCVVLGCVVVVYMVRVRCGTLWVRYCGSSQSPVMVS